MGADTPMGTIGAKRLVSPALKVKDLPPIDLVLTLPMLTWTTWILRRCEHCLVLKVVTAHNTSDLLAGERG